MRKSNIIFNIVICLGLFSCNSTRNIQQNNTKPLLVNKVQQATKFISNDTVFIERLIKYYPDLEKCKDLKIEANSTIRPVSIEYFRKNQLIKTSFFNKDDNLNDVEFAKLKSQYDISNTFKDYDIGLNNKNSTEKCKIKLTFSEENNNLLPVKFYIVDEEIDSRITYKPRVGYYLVEFDSSSENIIQRFYILKSN